MPTAGRPASGYGGVKQGGGRGAGGSAYRVGMNRAGGGRTGMRNAYQMYLGGSPNFNERTGQYDQQGNYNLGRAGPGGMRGGWFEPWMQRPGMAGRYGGINPGGGDRQEGMMRLMQQMAQRQQMRRMQQAAMARMMMGGGRLY